MGSECQSTVFEADSLLEIVDNGCVWEFMAGLIGYLVVATWYEKKKVGF
jgi:hypothetical protein